MKPAKQTISHGYNQPLVRIDADQGAPAGSARYSRYGLQGSVEEQQRAGLKRLVHLLGKKIVALRNRWLLGLDAEDSGIKRVLGNSRIDCLAGYLKKRQGLPFGVEIAAVDRCESAAFLGERFGIGALELKLSAA